MVHEDLRCGEKYGFRERPRLKTVPLECIQLLKHIRGRKWQARWIDTYPELVDYINSVQIVIPWGERKAFFKKSATTPFIASLRTSARAHTLTSTMAR